MLFDDRRHAGRVLADRLRDYHGMPGIVVLALPRGGVPVAFEVANALEAPLDVFIVRKLGIPGYEEFAMGAIATGGVVVTNPEAARLQIPRAVFDAAVEREKRELTRREQLYRHGRSPLVLEDRTVVLVDDGLATGSTMKAAIKAVRQHIPKRIVVAVPVAAESTCAELKLMADEVVCVETPQYFRAVGIWYRDFAQTSDAEVRALLDEASLNQSVVRTGFGASHGQDRAARG
jgi:predicted phosphoribosyltransferase